MPGATVGGTLATNASGPQRVLAGTARDLLIGITVVRADGVVAKAGGRVVKNVAGYDLGKLMIGSYGTLAVITEAVFRLHPLPDVERWVVVPVDDADRAHDLAQAVVHSQAVPVGGRGRLPRDRAGQPRGAARRQGRGRRRPGAHGADVCSATRPRSPTSLRPAGRRTRAGRCCSSSPSLSPGCATC